jgi:hypothetical protein
VNSATPPRTGNPIDKVFKRFQNGPEDNLPTSIRTRPHTETHPRAVFERRATDAWPALRTGWYDPPKGSMSAYRGPSRG